MYSRIKSLPTSLLQREENELSPLLKWGAVDLNFVRFKWIGR